MAKSTRSDSRPSHDPTKLGRDFRQKLKRAQPLLAGSVMEYVRPSLVKLYKQAGFDFIYLENEHTTLLTPQLSDFILAARDNGLPVVAKTSQLDRGEITRLLDAGVVGIQLPRTESRGDLTTLIDLMKYPPVGTRAAAPCLGNVDYVSPQDSAQWLKKANRATLVVAHIETSRGYDNAEQIVSTKGVDMVYVGPFDLSIYLGHPGDADHPKVNHPMIEILELCKKHKVAFGTSASSPKTGRQWIKRGCQFFEMDDEMTFIASAASEAIAAYRQVER